MSDRDAAVPAADLDPAVVARIRELRALYPVARSAVLPALWAVQDRIGYLPAWSEEVVGRELGLLPADVAAVASFYSMYFGRPVGRHVIQVCQNVSCALRGADDLLDHLRGWLGVDGEGESPDGAFSLEGTVECLGACGGGPMMQVDRYSYEGLTPERAEAILTEIRETNPEGPVGG
ncbi:MAG: NAD(P)H-dependent oxidoreductase subunit E [Candidatus Dormiibacterota bacterium]